VALMFHVRMRWCACLLILSRMRLTSPSGTRIITCFPRGLTLRRASACVAHYNRRLHPSLGAAREVDEIPWEVEIHPPSLQLGPLSRIRGRRCVVCWPGRGCWEFEQPCVTSAVRPDPLHFSFTTQVKRRAVAHVTGDAIRAFVGCRLCAVARVGVRRVISLAGFGCRLGDYQATLQLIWAPLCPAAESLWRCAAALLLTYRVGRGGDQ